MIPRILSCGLMLGAVAAFACGPAPGPPSGAEEEGAVENGVAQEEKERWPGGEAWVVAREPAMVIGVQSGPEEYELVDVADATRRSDGSVVVVDGGASAVRLYGPGGEFVQTLGGPGAGPGEFTDPGPVLMADGDTAVVWDHALLRATTFGPGGELAGVRRVDWGKLAEGLGSDLPEVGKSGGEKGGTVSAGLFPGPMEPLAGGEFLVRLVEKAPVLPPPGSGPFRPRSGLVRVGSDLTVVDTLLLFGDTEQVVVNAPWGPFAVVPPGARETRFTHSGDPRRVCVGDQEEPRVVCVDSKGERRTIRWVAEPVPLFPDDVSAWRGATVELLAPKLSRAQVIEILDQVPVPRFAPPYSQIQLDAGGYLWIGGGAGRSGEGASKEYRVFDPEGILLGSVAVPPIRILEVGQDYILGVYEDDLEIQYLHFYRLQKP